MPTIWLDRGRDRVAANDLLAAAAGGRVGLDGVLARLDRRATVLDTRGTGARYGFSWDAADQRSHWWPQGITSSADSGEESRPVLLTSSYAKVIGGVHMGSRITVVDLAARPAAPAYAHVLLVQAVLDEDGLEVRPVRAHVGGIAWRGRHLHVASTARGIHTFDLDDIVPASPGRLGVLPSGGVAGHDHAFLLPVRHSGKAGTAPDVTPFRYSFLSVSHGRDRPRLWAGEYGRDGASTRLAAFDLEDDGRVAGDSGPAFLSDGGVDRMQGVVAVDGRLQVTTSNGRLGRGSIWVGSPGDLRERAKVLPPGPEDLCYRPDEDELWTVTEYPRRRHVLALRRDVLAGA